jgi:uncharacterized protein YndB with AHSA1/START domain
MLKKIAMGIVILVIVVLGYAATRPGTFRVERTASISAPPEKVYELLSDFHNWPAWSPWEKMDPAMKKTHSGAASGTGAVYAWEGNSKVGKGRMEITAATAPSSVVMRLDFLSPFEAHNTAEFTLRAHDESTEITWAMYGANNFMCKVMGLVCSMDKMVGKDFETGLASLKDLAEK